MISKEELNMANENVLLDSYCAQGTDINAFYDNLQQMADRTYISSVYGRDTAFLSAYSGNNLKGYSGTDISQTIPFRYISQEAVRNFQSNNTMINIGFLKKGTYNDDVVAETIDKTGLVICVDKLDKDVYVTPEKMFVSTNCLKTITQRAAISGNTIFGEKSVFRDMLLASSIFNRNERMKFVYRKAGRTTKLFSVFSEYYPRSKQDILITAMKHPDFPFKDFVFKEFKITNFLTQAVFVKPDADTDTGIVPGVIILNSDVGCSYFTVRNVFFINDSYVIQSEESAKHSSSLTSDKMLDMFATARKKLDMSDFIDKMKSLKEVYIPCCGYTDDEVISIEDIIQKTTDANAIVKDALKAVYNAVMSKKCILDAFDKISGSLYGWQNYSYYDFAKKIIEASSMFDELDSSTQLSFHRDAFLAPDVLTELIKKYKK